jgi:hypothetical protein
MGATYRVTLSDVNGTPLVDVPFTSLKYSRVTNDVSTLIMELPSTFNTQLIRIPDGRVEVWRKIDGGREYLDTETTWLIKKLGFKRNAQGLVTTIVEADTPLSIFREPGRIASGYAGSAQVTFANGPADSAIKGVAIYNIGVLALLSRQLVNYISIQPDTLQAASTGGKAFAWRDCLKVMQEMAQASTANGVYCAFDIVAPTPNTLEFRTYVGQRGVDHRFPGGNNPVLLSPDMGNLGETDMRFDYRDMASVVVIGGAGQGTARVVTSQQDTTLQALSPFSYREKFIENTQTADVTKLYSDAYAALRASRPRITFTGKILDTHDTQYGVHWGWGDYVTAQDFGRSFDCRIEAVTVTVKPGADDYETVEAWLRSEVYVA